MSHNFKPGDLAMIVGAVSDTRNIGKTGELIELIPAGGVSIFILPNGKSARNLEEAPCWLLAGDGLTQSNPGGNGFAIRYPRFLMPLRGDFTHEQQKVKEAV